MFVKVAVCLISICVSTVSLAGDFVKTVQGKELKIPNLPRFVPACEVDQEYKDFYINLFDARGSDDTELITCFANEDDVRLQFLRLSGSIEKRGGHKRFEETAKLFSRNAVDPYKDKKHVKKFNSFAEENFGVSVQIDFKTVGKGIVWAKEKDLVGINVTKSIGAKGHSVLSNATAALLYLDGRIYMVSSQQDVGPKTEENFKKIKSWIRKLLNENKEKTK